MTLSIKDDKENEGEIELLDVNNHDADADFEYNIKIKTKELYQSVKESRKDIDSYIKELFKSFWEVQCK